MLLDGSASGPSEQDAPPNLTLRPEAFVIINELRELVHKKCGQVVSCSDIVALAARDSIALVCVSLYTCILFTAEIEYLHLTPWYFSQLWK